MRFTVGRVGSLISGRYELKEHIYTSNMSSVLKAWDYKEDRFVVVKISTDTVQYSNLVECLKREAGALSRIDHPRVVRVFDSGNIGPSHFIVLEYIHGTNLANYIHRHGRLFLDAAISVGIDLLEGLEAIHKEGIVHRDLKPENLITTRIGVKIIDLGLAVSTPAAEQKMDPLDSPGMVSGTPPYLSPEQAQGSEDLDARSDLYACGVILYELLTGALPFYNFKKDGQIFKYWQGRLRPFWEVSPAVDVPDKVQAVVWKALAVDPKDRYQTAEEMRMALLEVMEKYVTIPLP
ncbi:MAG: serine/threonine protein kinase, bacterial [Parcubacteria group bacterium Gr01-1014_13]|nr:MAG: serine/threonine protein kinase, bacterial [Parcubacteria group bacterium Gr01-1014_13]